MRLFVCGAKAAKSTLARGMPMAPRRIATHDGTFHCTCGIEKDVEGDGKVRH